MESSSHVSSIAVILFALGGPVAAQKTPAVRLDVGSSPGAANSFLPEVAASGASVYVAWEDNRNGAADVYFNRSLDAGSTWLPADIRLDVGDPPGNETSAAPQIAAAGASVYVTWEDVRNGRGDIYFNRSLDAGATWLTQDVRLDVGSAPGAAISAVPRIACSGSSVYVAWQDFRNGDEDIYLNRSLDGGASWLPTDVRLDIGDPPGANRSGMPQIAASGASVFVAYWDVRNHLYNTDVYFNRSLDGGTTWLPTDVRLDVGSAPGAAASDAQVLAASGASVYVAWQDQRNGFSDIYFIRSLDGGTTWLPVDVRLDLGTLPGASTSDVPEIASSGSSVYVTWRQGFGVFLSRSLDSGTSWLPAEVKLSSGVGGLIHPQIASSESSVYVTWEERVGSIHQIELNRSLDGGETWLPMTVRLDAGLGVSSLHPQISASGSSVYTAFQNQQSTGKWDIYFVLALGFQPYGSGTPGSGGIVPTISGSGNASVGGTLAIEVANGVGGAFGALLVGMNGSASIPVDGGTLLVQPPLQRVPFQLGGKEGAPGAGSTTLSFAIPNELALIGTHVNFQARLRDPGAARLVTGQANGISFTGGLEAWIL